MLHRAKRRHVKKILVAWNRGLGDIPLGLYALVYRIKEILPEAEVTFLVREGLLDGFSMLSGVRSIGVSFWKRGEPYDVAETLKKLGIKELFDWTIDWPNPTKWLIWQRGVLTPRLKWEESYDELCKKFGLQEGVTYIGAQLTVETSHGPWRNWPIERWKELIGDLEKGKNRKLILFGQDCRERLESPAVLDLRGKTTLFEMLSLLKNRCQGAILPDSGILSLLYYLDGSFPLRLVSLWADPNQGVLKQNVPSPNPLLVHRPLIGARRDLSTVQVKDVLRVLAL